MSGREMQEKFVTYLQLAYPLAEVKDRPDSTTIFYFINKACKQFVDSIYRGHTPTKLGAEGNKYNSTVLRNLISYVTESVTEGTDLENSYVADLPSDMLYPLSEEVTIKVTNLNDEEVTVRQGITESNSDLYAVQVDNPYSEHNLHFENAKPLRLFSEDKVELVTDGNYEVTDYHLRYYKDITEIDEETNEDEIELPNSVHEDIIDFALSLYLRNISGNRYSNRQSEQNSGQNNPEQSPEQVNN